MTSAKKFPLWAAIFMSINIVVGGGFFISSHEIFGTSGMLAPLPWLVCGLLLLPLVSVLAQLSRRYPHAGGLYVYSQKTLGDFWGFISGWGYFIGTLAGNAIILYSFSKLARDLGFPIHSLFWTNIAFLVLFTALNLLNITILERIHIGFTILKIIPFGLVLIAMFFLFDFSNVTAAPIKPFGLIESMPKALFAYLGIEACCAISHQIKSGEKNAARAMLISMGIIMVLYATIQFALLGILGVKTTNPFFEIIPLLTTNPLLIHYGNLVIKLAILSSFLGGFYGMYYANAWNLYAIAKEKRIVFSDFLSKLNKYNTPWACILVQGALLILFLLISLQSPASLMTMSDFGVVVAYIMSTITYFVITQKRILSNTMGLFALVGCIAFLGLCLSDLVTDGFQYLLPFLGLLAVGLVLYRK